MDKKNLKLRLSEILTRGVAEVIERRSLENKLKSGRKLRIKHGIDPTGPNIHIGRAIQFWKLKKFQDMGHKIVFIIGDFTAQIGDASDKQAARKPLTAAEVSKNMKRGVLMYLIAALISVFSLALLASVAVGGL